jgi:hypothetical protein
LMKSFRQRMWTTVFLHFTLLWQYLNKTSQHEFAYTCFYFAYKYIIHGISLYIFLITKFTILMWINVPCQYVQPSHKNMPTQLSETCFQVAFTVSKPAFKLPWKKISQNVPQHQLTFTFATTIKPKTKPFNLQITTSF